MKKFYKLLFITTLVFSLASCSAGQVQTTTTKSEAQNSTVASVDTGTTSTETTAVSVSAVEALSNNSETHEDAQDYVWESSTEIPITLNGDSIVSTVEGVTVDGSTATITSAGTYNISGTLTDGKIIVDTKDEEIVRLIFNGVDIHCSTSAPIYISNAEKTIIILADNTENTISDGISYVFENSEENEPDAAIFSKSDLTIYGNGSLTILGNYNDGIVSKDGLIIASGTVTVNSIDDGIRGKDYLVVKNGNITLKVQGEGLKSDNEEDVSLGYITIENGVIQITSGGDAISAQTDVVIMDGEFSLSSGGGSNNQVDETTSAKGIKGIVLVQINGGRFTIDSADDCIHTNGNLVVNNGTYTITSEDDGMHANSTLEINGGDIQITQSYEGIESAVITINAGNIHIVASDDGINGAGGNDSSGMNPGMGNGGKQKPGGGGPRQDSFTSTGKYYIYIHGGYTVVDANGDGIDVNGAIEMTDGIVLVNGPTSQGNGALDYDSSFNISGGYFIAAGSSGMAMAPSGSSSQYSVLINFTSSQPVGSLVHIQNSTGEDILTFSPTKEFQSILLSSSELESGSTYDVYTGGSSSGSVVDGLYQDGSYTQGSTYDSFTISDIVTNIGTGGNRR